MAAPAIAEAARRLGAGIVTRCAVRGVETTGGRVSSVVNREGRIALRLRRPRRRRWSRLFCGNLGIGLPQLKVLASVNAHRAHRRRPLEISASGGLFGFANRMDGGYTRRDIGGSHDRPRSQTISGCFTEYLPAARLHWKKIAGSGWGAAGSRSGARRGVGRWNAP